MISLFNDIKTTTPSSKLTVKEYFKNIKSGKWKAVTNKARAAKSDEDYKKAKESAPLVTFSGTFTKRKASELINHSGFILMDVDSKDNDQDNLDAFPMAAINDQYIYSFHKSIGGKGFAIIVKINPEKHTESFRALMSYFHKEYGLICDKSCKDVSRARFVSFDESLYLNEDAFLFEEIDLFEVKEDKRKMRKYAGRSPQLKNTIRIANDLIEANPNCLDDYEDWLKIGFALVDGHGEDGREAFHVLSSSFEKYKESDVDFKYDTLLEDYNETLTKKITMGSFYELAKSNSISIIKEFKVDYSPTRTQKEAIEIIKEFIIAEPKPTSDQIFEMCKTYVDTYEIKKNTLTDALEVDGQRMKENFEDVTLGTLRSILPPTKVRKQYIEEIVKDKSRNEYNPLIDYMNTQANKKSSGVIDHVLSCLELEKEENQEVIPLIRKWLISLVATVYGKKPELCLVLVGPQGCGKTTFFENILPSGLQPYMKSGDFSDDKDNKLMTTEKLLLLNDEMTGFHKSDWARFKALISTDHVSERRAYGRRVEEKQRLAVFAGATNDEDFLSDTTGNRRIIPVNMKSIKYHEFLAIDKDLLFTELMTEYLSDEDWSYRLTKEEQRFIKDKSDDNRFIFDDELAIRENLTIPVPEDDIKDQFFLSATEVKEFVAYINPNTRNSQSSSIGRTMKRLGFKSDKKYNKGSQKRGFYVTDASGALRAMGMSGFNSILSASHASPFAKLDVVKKKVIENKQKKIDL